MKRNVVVTGKGWPRRGCTLNELKVGARKALVYSAGNHSRPEPVIGIVEACARQGVRIPRRFRWVLEREWEPMCSDKWLEPDPGHEGAAHG